ncbi:unnamed protein product [Prunus armeniaca]|uniref:Uncharacterized protein n=1 Tax=Prunus armeniaca TaxID=36596 RepID=A0A6J5XSZ3_PRUAR|nr:unnamed protein product [Prunus armeniaca]
MGFFIPYGLLMFNDSSPERAIIVAPCGGPNVRKTIFIGFNRWTSETSYFDSVINYLRFLSADKQPSLIILVYRMTIVKGSFIKSFDRGLLEDHNRVKFELRNLARFHSDGGIQVRDDHFNLKNLTQQELYPIRDGDGNEDDVVQGDDDVQVDDENNAIMCFSNYRRRWNCGHENEMEENESEVEKNEGSLEEIEGDDDLEEIANGAVGENKNEEVEEKAVDEII